MAPTKFKKAFYIKLGRGGAWEADAIGTGKLRFGWPDQKPADINGGHWGVIEDQLRGAIDTAGAATQSLHGLQIITQSTPDDLWITFHQGKLWWTRLGSSPVAQDGVSKFRRTIQPWSDRSIKNRLLVNNDLPGRLAQLQGYRWTVCNVSCPELLQRVLAGTRSPLATAISSDRAALAQHLSEAIKALHWKDFETLADLVFRHAGWVRVSVLGQHAHAYDPELQNRSQEIATSCRLSHGQDWLT